MRNHVLALVALSVVTPAAAADLVCHVTRRVSDGVPEDPRGYIEKYKPSVRVVEVGSKAKVARCSFSPSEGKVTCDWYEVDRVEVAPRGPLGLVNIRKYYVFRQQFDVQVFYDGKERTVIENNGRGGIAWGTCESAP